MVNTITSRAVAEVVAAAGGRLAVSAVGHTRMKAVMAEGLKARYARHRAYGKAVRAALATYGLKPLAEAGIEAPTLTTFRHVEGTDDAAFRAALAKRGMIVAGALASLAGKAFRLGHMGSTTPEMLEKAITLIGEVLNELGMKADSGKAVAEFRKVYLA